MTAWTGLAALVAGLFSSTAAAEDYYAAPGGRGDGRSEAAPMTVVAFWAVARPGDRLWLLDGRYTGDAAMIRPPEGLSGREGAPITVRARRDGGAWIDGEGARQPVRLQDNDWFVLEGFDASSAGGGPSVSVFSIRESSHVVVRRVVAWDATDGNTNVFGAHGSEHVLFEDCAGFGTARKIFSTAQGGNHVTFRRCFARWEGSHAIGPKKAFTLSYNSYDVLMENCVATWDAIGMRERYRLLNYDGTERAEEFTDHEVQMATGIISHDDFDDGFPDVARIRVLGSIALLKGDQRYSGSFRTWFGPVSLWLKGITVTDTIAYIEPRAHTDYRALFLDDPGASGLNRIERGTVVGGTGASIHRNWSATSMSIGADCPTLIAGTGHMLDARGAGRDGATIMRRIVDGTETPEPLWPWPMDGRIRDALMRAGRKPYDVTREVFTMCGGRIPPEFETPPPPPVDAGSPLDGGDLADAGPGTSDAAVDLDSGRPPPTSRDAALPAGDAAMAAPPESVDGCGCTVPGRRRSDPWFALPSLAVAVGLGARVSRRRRGAAARWPGTRGAGRARCKAGSVAVSMLVATAALGHSSVATAQDLETTVGLARMWLDGDEATRATVEPMIRRYTGPVDDVVARLRQRTYTETGDNPSAPPGAPPEVRREHWDQAFRLPRYAHAYRDHLFHFVVPEHYRPDRPIGLFIWMHGGAGYFEGQIEWLKRQIHRFEGGKRSYPRPETDRSDFILVAPIAPFGHLLPPEAQSHASRWTAPGADEYLIALIEEMQSRYNVDTDRVVLAGFSMGGIGAYHQALRLNDRASAVFMSAGSWKVYDFGALANTPVFIHHGATDSYWNSATDYRWRGTDIAYARLFRDFCVENRVDHQYLEYPGGHAWDDVGERGYKMFIDGMMGFAHAKRRDPFARRVVAVSPRTTYEPYINFGIPWAERPSPHTLWVTLHETGTDEIPFAHARREGAEGCRATGGCPYDEWASFRLHRDTLALRAGRLVATLEDGRIDVRTDNVRSFSLWLHPRMVDLSRPVTVVVDGDERMEICSPSVVDALRAFERRRDWNLAYHCEIRMDVARDPGAPRARIRVTPPGGAAPLTATLDGTASEDADGRIVAWRWTVDGRGVAEGATTVHTFESAGIYEVGLEVVDNDGKRNFGRARVEVTGPGTMPTGDGGFALDAATPPGPGDGGGDGGAGVTPGTSAQGACGCRVVRRGRSSEAGATWCVLGLAFCALVRRGRRPGVVRRRLGSAVGASSKT
jgi:dienelactone hydrolase